MCHNGTAGIALRWAACLLAAGLTASAQTPEWRKIGATAVDWRLAAPATGPVVRAWFSPQGGNLFARTQSGRIFQTADFATWTPASAAVEPPPSSPPYSPSRLPEAGVRVVAASTDGNRIYALGRQLYGSEDGGQSWSNLTAFRSNSVVGGGIRDVAVAPGNDSEIVVANDYGLWRSLDGGLSWTGLNVALPNLPVRRILATQGPAGGTRIQANNLGVLELPPGGRVWQPVAGAPDNERQLREAYSSLLRAEVTAVAVSQDRVYAGSSDGRLWVIRSGFPAAPANAGGPVERIFADPAAPEMALAAIGGNAPQTQHVLRTTNGGLFWDPLDYNLPNSPAHGITADRAAGAVYVATDQGVFYGRADLQNAATNPVNWVNLTTGLTGDSPVPAVDVRLDPAGSQLYIAVDGYGVFATLAPHRRQNPQIVNAADYSTRPAAPGSLLSVLGARVSAVRGANLEYPVLAAADGESQIQVPFEALGPNVSLELETAGGNRTLGVAVLPVSPAILVSHDGTPALFDADTGLPLDSRNAAHSNGRVQIMATGLGKVLPKWPTGMPAPLVDPPAVEAPIKAFLDGAPLQVTRATLASGYVGFYIVEVQLPLVTNLGASSLYISADGQESNRVQLVLEP